MYKKYYHQNEECEYVFYVLSCCYVKGVNGYDMGEAMKNEFCNGDQ